MNNPKEKKNVRTKTQKSISAESNELGIKNSSVTNNFIRKTRAFSNNDKYKIILVGDTGVGKTAIVNRFIDNVFKKDHNCTIGVEFFVKSVNFDNNVMNLLIWDTCGQERYRTITKQYYRNVAGCMVVFDISKKNTFDNIKYWMKDVLENGIEINTIILVGNKEDLRDVREVSEKDVQELISQNNIKYIEVSAKSGSNVHQCFQEIAKKIFIQKEHENSIKLTNHMNDQSITLCDVVYEKDRKNCC